MQIALVTGANRGIGQEVAKQLAAAGQHVLVGSRDLASASETIDAIHAAGDRATPVQLDISDLDSIEQAVLKAAQLGGIDVLVNNAAITYDTWQRALEPDFEVVREAIETNVFGTWQLTVALADQLRATTSARVVNVSSGAGALTDMGAGLPAYRISKVALSALTRMWAAELPGARVNAVCPGWVATDMGGAGGRPVTEGAAGVTWAALLPNDGPTGGFFRDQQAIDW